MPVARTSTISNQNRNKKAINKKQQKPTISSPLVKPFSPNHDHLPTTAEAISKKKNKKNFTTFKGLGCKATTRVTVPLAITRISADWESKKVKKKNKKNKKLNFVCGGDPISDPSCFAAADDVWCRPGIGLTTDIDCVVSTRPLSSRGRVHVDKITPRERSSCSVRRMVRPGDNPFLDSDDPFLDSGTMEVAHFRPDWFGSRHYCHSRYGFPEGFAEIVVLQNNLMGGRTDGLDRYRSLRLDVDNMSYEELLELGDRIGYVSTGLRENEITRRVRRTKPFFLNNLSHIPTELEKKCSICQEEYEAEDEMGKLGCGHSYHIPCINQWLMHKNNCPVCKSAAISDG